MIDSRPFAPLPCLRPSHPFFVVVHKCCVLLCTEVHRDRPAPISSSGGSSANRGRAYNLATVETSAGEGFVGPVIMGNGHRNLAPCPGHLHRGAGSGRSATQSNMGKRDFGHGFGQDTWVTRIKVENGILLGVSSTSSTADSPSTTEVRHSGQRSLSANSRNIILGKHRIRIEVRATAFGESQNQRHNIFWGKWLSCFSKNLMVWNVACFLGYRDRHLSRDVWGSLALYSISAPTNPSRTSPSKRRLCCSCVREIKGVGCVLLRPI